MNAAMEAMWMRTVLTLVALTTAPVRKEMENVAKVHVVTFVTIFECIIFNSCVSFGVF